MNKADVIDRLTMRIGDKRVAEAALDGIVDIITRSVTSGEKVSITGFGTFEKVNRKARKARNPRTGEKVRVAKSSAPKFRPGSVFKGAVNGTMKLGREMKAEPLLPSGITGTRMLSKVTGSAASTSTATTRAGTAKRTTRKASTAQAGTRGAKKTTARATKSAAPARKAATRKTAAKASSRKATTAKASARKASTGRASAGKSTAKKATGQRAAR